MSQLIQGLIAPRPTEQSLISTITEVMRNFPTPFTPQLPVPATVTPDSVSQAEENYIRAIIDAYIVTYYYVGLANIGLQGIILSAFNTPQEISSAQTVIDNCYSFFYTIEEFLNHHKAKYIEEAESHSLF
jgi:hypothetical protein